MPNIRHSLASVKTESTRPLSSPQTVPLAVRCCLAPVAALQARAPGKHFQIVFSFFSLSKRATLPTESLLELEDVEVLGVDSDRTEIFFEKTQRNHPAGRPWM